VCSRRWRENLGAENTSCLFDDHIPIAKKADF